MNEHEVRFDIWCKRCKYFARAEEDDPCVDCLLESVNQNSKKPVYFKEDDNENTDSSTDV